MFKVNIAELRHKIEIQTFKNTEDEYGNEVKGYIQFKFAYAKIMNLHGQELYSAQSVNSKATVKFLIRYTKDLDTNMRIKFQDKFYNITYIDNVEYKNQWIFLHCEVVS